MALYRIKPFQFAGFERLGHLLKQLIKSKVVFPNVSLNNLNSALNFCYILFPFLVFFSTKGLVIVVLVPSVFNTVRDGSLIRLTVI